MDKRDTGFHRNGWRKFWSAALATVVAMSLASCGSDDSGDEDGGGGTSTLRFASYGPPIRSWDPHRDGRAASNILLFAVYDRLVHQDAGGDLVPGLATEWTFSDDTTFEMTLREGVTFQDGEPFDAEAVKANIERAQTVDEGTGPWAGPLGVVESVEVVDPTHVVMHLAAPAASLPTLLSDSAGAMISPKAFESVDLNETTDGAGMYELESWTADGNATLKAYDGYWDKDAVGPTTIEVPFQLDQLRRLDMFKADEVDATFGHTSFVAGAKDAGLDVDAKDGLNFWFMDVDQGVAPFNDKNVRLAINYALDRTALIDTLLQGEATENHQPFPESSVGFSDEIGATPYAQDLDEAEQLLADAGYADGLTFDCAIIPGSGGAYAQYAEVVADQLSKVGITMNIQQVESQSAALLIDNTVDCAIMPYGTLSPIVTAKQLFGATGYYNAAKAADAETTELLTALDQPQSDEELDADFDALMQHVVDNGMFISLFFEKWAVISNDKVEGLDFWIGGQYTEFRNVKVS